MAGFQRLFGAYPESLDSQLGRSNEDEQRRHDLLQVLRQPASGHEGPKLSEVFFRELCHQIGVAVSVYHCGVLDISFRSGE